MVENQIERGEEDNLLPADQWENTIPIDLVDHPMVLACQESDCAFLVTNPRLPGNPIVYINQGFLDMTGYAQNRILGRNCRFMQGPETDPIVVSKMREAIDDSRGISVTLLNYRADGSTFYNHIIISTIKDPGDGVLYFLGVTKEVSTQLETDKIELPLQSTGNERR